MRALLTVCCFVLATGFCCRAQTYIYAHEREYCAYSPATKKFDKCQSWPDQSIFVIDIRESRMEHVTDSVRSIYYVNTKEWNEEMQGYLWTVTSDLGTQYTYVIDLEKQKIIAYHDDGDKSFIVTFTVKKYWK